MATTQVKDGFQGGSDNQLKVNADGSINVNSSGGGGSSNVNISEVGGVAIGTSVPVIGTVTANQGTPNTLANGWPVELTDGTNLLGTSTHPLRIDPTGTTPQPVTGTFFQSVQPVSQSGTWSVTATQATGSNLHMVLDSGTLTSITNPITVAQATAANLNATVFQGTSPWVTSGTISGNVTVVQPTGANLHVDVDNFPATQPVSGTVAVSSVAGNVTVIQPTGSSLHVDIDNFPSTQSVTQGTSPWVVSGTVTANAGTGTFQTNVTGLPSFQTSQYTVGLSAVQLTVTPLTNRSSISIKAITTTGSDVVYIGNSAAVTTSTGYPLFNMSSVQMDLTPSQAIWAIGTSTGQLVYALELGG